MSGAVPDIDPGLAERLRAVLGPAVRVAYEATHVYPMSAPTFLRQPYAKRPHLNRPPLRLYVHVPFCNYACTFCFYAKRVGVRREQMDRYVRALRTELEWIEPGTPLPQLYVGGGTPTVLPPDLLDEVLAAIFDRMPRIGSEAHTVEASPESITAEHLHVLRQRGVDRVSLGIQSMYPAVLEQAHRRHSAEQALEACELVAASGLITNVDFIYGLPRQSEQSLRDDLESITRRGVHSLTLYDLRLNELTPLAQVVQDFERLDLERLVRWRAFVKRTAADLGFVQTRWHTFKRPAGPASRYERAPCIDGFGSGYQLGVGMSAVSHLGDTVYRNHEGLSAYMDRVERGLSPVEEIFPLAEEDRKTLFVARSIGDGRELDRGQYEHAFGCSIDHDFATLLARLIGAGLLEDDGERVTVTETGKLVYDLITLAFYPPRVRDWLEDRQTW